MSTTAESASKTAEYADHFFIRDPFRGLPEGRVVSFTEFVPDRDQADAFRREFLGPEFGDQILGVDVRFNTGYEGWLRVLRQPGRADFNADERELLQSLVPHVRNAIRLFGRFRAVDAEQSVYHGIVEQLSLASIVVDHDCKITRTNNLAERLLASGDGVSRVNGRLRLCSAQEQVELESLLRHIQDAHDPLSVRPLRFSLHRQSGMRSFSVVAKPFTTPAFMRGRAGAAAAIFITDPTAAPRIDPEAIRAVFLLTRMEALLAAMLGEGVSLVDAADKLGIAHNTARSHLRSVFAKTGTHRQSELVHLLGAGITELREGRA